MKKKLENISYIKYFTSNVIKARELRKNPTPAENKLWLELLSNRKMLNFKFLRQKPILGYIVDFYCSKLLLVIEVDGEIHNNKDNIEYDNLRTEILQSIGIKVVRFSNNQILENIDHVKLEIEEEIQSRLHDLQK